jgi:hypothetical protein
VAALSVVDTERIKNAIQWRLGFLPEEADAGQDWGKIEKWLLADHPARAEAMAAKMAEPLIEIIKCGMLREDAGNSFASWWERLKGHLETHPALPDLMTFLAASYFEDNFEAVKSGSNLIGEKIQTSMATTNKSDKSAATEPDSQSDESTTPATPEKPQSSGGEEITVPAESSAPDTNSPENNPPNGNPPSLSTQWRYIRVPDGPDKHDEFDQRADVTPEGLRIIGARVRGKKHKHEGTNCDDWFEYATSGPWTIIAVSDGAGSKVFSRIGARESCRAAREHLSEVLADRPLEARDNWTDDTFKRDKGTGVFAAADLEHVQQSLHEAMIKAYETVAAKALELAESPDHNAIVDRKVAIDDLSGTLLLAVHTIVMHDGAERSVVLTCQIGDGMLAAVTTNGGLQLLGVADSGEFAGQTDFLTSKKKLEKASLTGRTFPFFGPLQALMVMTDGVADDYFPNDPGMLLLYGDLALNGVLNLNGPNLKKDLDDIHSSLARTGLATTDEVKSAGIAVPVELLTEAEVAPKVLIRSITTYAEKLGLGPEQVAKSRPLLIAGTLGEPMCDRSICDATKKEDMLRVWLDSYHVRGSFDDRTLVLLFREVA